MDGIAALYAAGMIEIGNRCRSQPAPPHVVLEALAQPDRDPYRPWLFLLDDEQRPRVLRMQTTSLAWSSLWVDRPDAVIEFDLVRGLDGGTDLRWRLLVDEPLPTDSKIGHMRKRLNQLINADLRATFGH